MKQIDITLLVLLMALFALPCQVFAQEAEAEDDDAPSVMLTGAHAMYFFEKNPDTPGKMDAFLDINIEKIAFSCRDSEGNLYDHPVRQIVYAQDTVMIKNIEDIDSIALYSEPNKYNDKVFLIDDDIAPYVTRMDKSTFSFWLAKNCPRHPEQDQVVFTPSYDRKFNDYTPIGRVWRIDDDGDSYRYILNIVDFELKDIYERLVTVESQNEYRDEKGKVIGNVLITSAGYDDICASRPQNVKFKFKTEDIDFFKDKSLSLLEKVEKAKSIFGGKFITEGESLFDKNGMTLTYLGLMQFMPEDAWKEKYKGVYFTYGVEPHAHLRVKIISNIKSIQSALVDAQATPVGIDYDYICLKFDLTAGAAISVKAGAKYPEVEKKAKPSLFAFNHDVMAVKGVGEYSKNYKEQSLTEGKKLRDDLDYFLWPWELRFGWGEVKFDLFRPVYEIWAKGEVQLRIDFSG